MSQQSAADERFHLLADEPGDTGDERWDVFLAALAERLALRDHRRGPGWAERRRITRRHVPDLAVTGWGRASIARYTAGMTTRAQLLLGGPC